MGEACYLKDVKNNFVRIFTVVGDHWLGQGDYRYAGYREDELYLKDKTENVEVAKEITNNK
jgi:hypothetical protein